LVAAADDAEPHDFAGPTPHHPYDIFPDPNLAAVDRDDSVYGVIPRLGYAPRDDACR